MNHLIKIYSLLIITLFAFTGCDSDDDAGQVVTTSASYVFVVESAGEVTFINTSEKADTYAWDFGDGTTSTLKSPSKTYTTTGDYTVTLTVTDSSSGASDVFTSTVSVSVFNDGLLTNGNFEDGADPWTIGVGTDPVPVVTVDGNTYYSVNVTVAGAAFTVNMSQKLEIIAEETYTLTFDAWSDVDRTIVAGIGLSDGDFSNTSEEVSITTTQETYTLSLTATGFGAPNARVLFDSGAATGIVNIDNVILTQD